MSQKQAHTNVIVFNVWLVIFEQNVAGGDPIEFVPGLEVESKRALRVFPQRGDGNAECRGKVVDDVLEGIEVAARGREERWPARECDLRLAVCDLDTSDAVLREKVEDVSGRVVGLFGRGSVWHDTDPDCGGCGVDFVKLLEVWELVVVWLFLARRRVLFFLVLVSLIP